MNFNQIKFGKPVTYLDGVVNYLKGAMIWGFRSKYKWSQTTPDIWGFANPTDIDPESHAVYDRIIADGGVSNLTRLNYFVVGLKTIYATLDNVPVCYDAHWIGYKLGSGTGATAGQAAAKLYSLTVAGDAIQATAASQPLLLSHNGASSDNYYYGSGVSGNYVSTPNVAANQITGDIEVIAKFRINSLSNSGIILSKWSSNANNTGSYELFYSGNSRFQFYIQRASDGLSNNVLSGVFSLTINTDIYIKVNRVASTGAVIFYQSTDGITYNLISTSTLFAGENIYNSTALVKIGSEFAVDQSNINAKISRVTIANSIGGTPVVDFNPATYNASTSQTAWTSSTGEVWTISTGTATSGYKGQLVSRTIVQSDGVDDKIATTGVTLANNHTNYCAYKAFVQDSSGNRIIYNNGTTNFVNAIVSLSTNILFISLTNSIFGIGGTKVFQTLGLSTSVFGTNNTKSKINNGTFSTPLVGTYVGGDGISLFGAVTVHFANSCINTMIVSSSDDNATINTATYNLIRSLNNNSF